MATTRHVKCFLKVYCYCYEPLCKGLALFMDNIYFMKEDAMKYVKNRYRKIWMVEVHFISMLNNLGKNWKIWKLVVRARRGNRVNMVCINQNTRSCGICHYISYILEEVILCAKRPDKITWIWIRMPGIYDKTYSWNIWTFPMTKEKNTPQRQPGRL